MERVFARFAVLVCDLLRSDIVLFEEARGCGRANRREGGIINIESCCAVVPTGVALGPPPSPAIEGVEAPTNHDEGGNGERGDRCPPGPAPPMVSASSMMPGAIHRGRGSHRRGGVGLSIQRAPPSLP